MNRGALRRLSLGLVLPLLAPASLAAQVLDFEGLMHRELVQSFYAGGNGSMGSGPGPDHGITFADNALVGNETHLESNWTNTPSGTNILLFLSGDGATMNVPGGFSTGFSFWYSSTFSGGSVSVFSGLNSTGALLAILDLSPLGSCGGADPFCNWAPIGVAFDGTAMSVDFGGTANQIAFDNITLNSATPGGSVVPEPSTVLLLASGLAMLAGVARRRSSMGAGGPARA